MGLVNMDALTRIRVSEGVSDPDMGLISSTRINTIFKESLNSNTGIELEGIKNKYIINNIIVEKYRNEIKNMLYNLPPQFQQPNGWSLVCGCKDKEETLWTPHIEIIERLLLLGIVLGYVKCLAPKQYWGNFPFGYPFYRIKK